MIRRQILEVNLDKTQDVFQLQNELSQFYWKQVLPALEKVFDQLSAEEEVIQLEHLELKLGKLKLEMIISGKSIVDLYDVLLKQVREEILIQKKRAATDKPKSIALQWLHYMEKGWLDWNTMEIDHEWNRKVLETLATDYTSITALRHLVRKDPRARARIAMRHDEVFLLRLIEVLTAQKQDDIADLIKELNILFQSLKIKISLDYPFHGPLNKSLWSQAILLSAIHGSNMNARELAAVMFKLFITEKTNPAWNRILSAEIAHSSYFRKTFDEGFLKENLHFSLEETDRLASQDKAQSVREYESADRISEEQLLITKQLIEDGIFVNNAGLVLLHPFFTTFLARIELVKDRHFPNSLAHQKALHILNYLAMGREAIEEYELLMPKILLGYPIEELVSLDIHLTDAEKEEADDLLDTVIAKWEILRNTSKAGLREGFLQRRGKYFLKNDNYYVQVEQNSIDMLLDHLPWNLTIIKLPWMNQLLRVEWR